MPRMTLDRRRSRTSCSILALATVLAVGASPAAAQSFLGTGTYVTNPNVTGIVAPVGGTTTTINLNGGQTVIDWTPTDNASGTGTNILFQPVGTTALFTSGSDFAVLNRIVPTDINRAIVMNGTINSRVSGAQRGSVYFYSPGGFILGGSSIISVGSLVLTASPIQLTAGNFITSSGTSNTVTFGQALNPNAAIVSNGSISAQNAGFGIVPPGDSYVAMVAPKVVQGSTGAITVNGSAAMVAAEAATINFSTDGLFDIQVTVGSTSTSGVEVYGNIGGPASDGTGDIQRVYLVAVPKNDAMTMVIGNGADLGFTLANNASIDANGAVILSAGHDIIDGAIGGRSAGHGALATGNFWFTGAHATNNLFGEATGSAELYSVAGQLTTTFDRNVTVHALNEVVMGASGVGTSLTVGGNLSLSTNRTGAAGQSALAGTIELYAANSGFASVAGTTSLTANATGGNAASGSAGSGTGGNIWVKEDDGGTLVLQSLTASALGTGGNGLAAGVNGGHGTGGEVRLYADDAGSLTVNATLSLDASGTGGNASGAGIAGNGTGGGAYVYVGDSAAVTINGAATLTSDGQGGGHATGNGGSGTGGASRVTSVLDSVAGGLITFNGAVELSSDGTGGTSGGAGSGGTGTGGWARISTPDDHDVDLNSSANLHATGTGGTSETGTGGSGVGGRAEIESLIGAIDISGTVSLDSSGSGGSGNSGGGGTGGNSLVSSSADLALPNSVSVYSDGYGGQGFGGNGGVGTGGFIDVQAQGGGDLAIGSLYASAFGSGGTSGATGFASGAGFGGDIDIRAYANSALALSGDLYANADGYGGSVFDLGVNGGLGEGGSIELQATGANALLTLGGDSSLQANGNGGDGAGDCFVCSGAGGDGLGGTIDVAVDGTNAQLLLSGNLNGDAEGHGGTGGDANGGFGEGGSVNIRAFNGGSLDVAGDLDASADGIGGDREAGGFGGDFLFNAPKDLAGSGLALEGVFAGNGLGGTVELHTYGSNAPDIHIGGSATLSADGHGGNLNQPVDGVGGTGTGNNAWIGSNAGLIDIDGDATVSANGTGGDAAIGTGGNGLGGNAEVWADGGSVAIGGSAYVSVNGTGGNGTVGGDGTGGGNGDVENPIDGAHLLARNGSITLGGSAFLSSDGTGGDGADGGHGGDGTGGWATIHAANSDLGPSFITITGVESGAYLSADGQGGAGGAGIDGNDGASGTTGTNGSAGLTGGAGGDGAGGQVTIFANAGNGHVAIGYASGTATGTGGDGGSGGNGGDGGSGSTGAGGNGGAGGSGGLGGSGTGGYVGIGTASGNNQSAAANLGTADYGSIFIDASAFGGAGGSGGFGGLAGSGTPAGTAGSDGLGGAGGDAIGGEAILLVRGSEVTFGSADLYADGWGGSGGFGPGEAPITGNGGDGTGGSLGVIVTNRYLHEDQAGTLIGGAIFGTASGHGGAGALAGTGFVGNGATVQVEDSSAAIDSLAFTISGAAVAPGATESAIAIDNGSLTATGNFSLDTDGDLSLFVDQGTINVGSLSLSARDFVADGVYDNVYTDLGTVTAGSATISTGMNFIATADFDINSDFSLNAPGFIAAHSFDVDGLFYMRAAGGDVTVADLLASGYLDASAADDFSAGTIEAGQWLQIAADAGSLDAGTLTAGTSIAFSAGGTASLGNLDAGTDVSGQTGGGMLLANVLAGNEVDLVAGGLIAFGLIDAGGDVDLIAGTSITGTDIDAVGNIFAQTGNGNIALATLTSTGGGITLDAQGDISLSGDLAADGNILLGAADDIAIRNAISGESIAIEALGDINGLNLTAGDSIDVEAGNSVVLANLSAGLVNPSTNPDAEFVAVIRAGLSIQTGNIGAAEHIGLATPGTITTGDIDAGGIFMALGHGNMSFGDATASEVFLADFAELMFGGGFTGTACVGACGTLGADGVVVAPPSGPSYSFVTTEGGVNGAGQIPGEGGSNGSLYTTSAFSASAGDPLNFWFNYVTSDGSGFADYAWAALYTASLDPVATLFTARTQPSGTIVPGQNLPAVEATLDPASVPIIAGAPTWSALGGSSGSCYSAGCGYTGWVNSTYTIADSGTYILRFGVSNWSDTAYQSGLAFSGITIGGVPVTSTAARTGGSISIGDVDTAKFTAAAGTSLTTGIIDSTGGIGLDAGAAIVTGNLFAGDFVLANGGSILTGNIDAASVDMTSTGGNIGTGNILADGPISLDAAGDITTLNLTSGLDIELTAGDDIDIDDIVAGTEFHFEAAGDVVGGNITAGLEIGGEGAGGSVTFGNLTAGFGEGVPDDLASIGFSAGGPINVGNVNGALTVGFATQGSLTTGTVQAGDDFIALAAGNITTGSITTGAGDQVYMAHYSMCATAGGCSAEGEFDPDVLFALDPVATGGSITINGPVTTGLFEAAAGTGLTAQAITAGTISARAGGTATLNGMWTSPDVTLISNDIAIGASGGIDGGSSGNLLLRTTNSGGLLIGDGLSGTGYALSNAEFSRIGSGDITIVAGGFAGVDADSQVGDLTVTAGPTGNIRSSDGGLAIVTLAESGESPDGTLRVLGDVAATGFGDLNHLSFVTEHFELDVDTGSISITSSGGALGGELGLYADTIHVAEGAILDQLADNPTYTGYQQDLNEAASVQRPEGVLRAGTLWIESDNLSSVLIQNTGSASAPAGFVVREAFINDDEEVAGPPGSINLVVNGQVVTDGGTLTGVAARDALVGEEADITPFTSNSTINGCPLTGQCIIRPPAPPTTDIVDNQIDLFTNNPLGDGQFGNEEDIDDNQEGDDSADNPISPPQPLFDTRPLIPGSDIDDPVSGTGNPALLGSEAQCKDENEDGQCDAPAEGEAQ